MTTNLSPEEIARSHRWHAIECNNLAWKLSDQPLRTATEDEDMLNAAHASAFHWAKTGDELNRARAHMLLGRVHASLGHGEMAMDYARRSSEYLLAHDPPDWEAAFAHAVLAHAAYAQGDAALHRLEHGRARELGTQIADLEDSEIFFRSFEVVPLPQPLGFLAVPPAGKGQGVLVLHPWWGLNATIKAFCTRLAEAGYVAYAPDLYGGKLATTIEEAESLSSGLDEKEAKADVGAAVDFLSGHAEPGGLAVIGFSLGAFFALDVSAADPERIRAVILFYGTGPGEFGASQAAYLGHFAEADPYEPDTYVNELKASLREAGRPVTFYRYPGVGHWFFEPDRADAYDPAAAALAWERTLAFLEDSLSSGSR